MKIAIIIRFLTRTGGATREAFMLAKMLQEDGNQVVIYTFAFNPATCFPGLNPDVDIKALEKYQNPPQNFFTKIPLFGTRVMRWYENKNAKALARIIDTDTEVLNPHDQISTHVAYYFKRRMPHVVSVWMMNDLDIEQWSLFDDVLLGGRPKRGVRWLVAWLRDWYENRKFFSRQDAIAFIVDITRQRARRFLGLDGTIVRSGLDLEQFAYRERAGIFGKKIKLLCQGIFYNYRRFEDVILALPNLIVLGYEPELTIIGDFGHKDTARSYYASLCKLVEELGLHERVTFAGVVSEEALAHAYREADIFVFASIQTWGIAIFEAMASGTPVIISDIAGATEVLIDHKTALFAKTGDPDDFARAARELAEDRELYCTISREGNLFVSAQLSWSRYAEAMMELFRRTYSIKTHPKDEKTIAPRERLLFFVYGVLAFFLSPILLLRAYRRKKYIDLDHPRVLVVPMLRRIGDLVCATAVFRAIKEKFPEAHLSVVVGGNIMPLIARNPRVDQVININDTLFAGWLGRGKFFLFLFRQHFDWAIALVPSPLHSFINIFSCASVRIKTIRQERSSAEVLTDWFNNKPILFKNHTSLPGHYLRLLEEINVHASSRRMEVFVTTEGERKAEAFLQEKRTTPSSMYVGICVSAGSVMKEWGDARFSLLTKRILDDPNMHIFFIGTADDEERIDVILRKLESARAYKIIDFSLAELPSLVKRCSMIIAGDTGIIYIAYALGVPLIDILGPVDSREQPPEDEKSILIRPQGVNPSRFVFAQHGPAEIQRAAMDAITIEEVWRHTQKMLEYIHSER